MPRLGPVWMLVIATLCAVPTWAAAPHARPRAGTAAAATVNRQLERLCSEYWEGHLRLEPVDATSIGDRRYDAFLDDNTPAGIARARAFYAGVLARARALPVAALDAAHRLDRAALIESVQDRVDRIDCHFELWNVDPRSGPQTDFMNLPDYTTIETPADAAHFVSRARAMGPYVDHIVANLATGLAVHKVSNRRSVETVIAQLDTLLAHPAAAWPLADAARQHHAGWSEADSARFSADLEAAIHDRMMPAFGRYAAFLQRSVLSRARPDDRPGMVSLPGGLMCYRKLIRIHTSLPRTPEALHALGLAEVKRIRAALSDLGSQVLGTADVAEIQRRLRTDPAMHFASADEVEHKARETLGRARAAIPQWFHLLPKADCEVRVMGMHEAPYSTIAYYRNPAQDGSRPGYYMINTYLPETRPKYEAEALAFHESIPGHHLQIAIAMELTGLPEFRKHEGVTAFVEGWGLYSERLADDMHLYSGDIDRIGMLSYDAWRACRLVVDTGLHAMGWSRQQAIDYMVENTVLAENNIANEVDRYITDPGQALAYKVGQLEILKLRQEAKDKLGAAFDIKGFHDTVLENGAVALPVLREQVERWIARSQARP
jgi:uncharacterized protein (DUF885 family)